MNSKPTINVVDSEYLEGLNSQGCLRTVLLWCKMLQIESLDTDEALQEFVDLFAKPTMTALDNASSVDEMLVVTRQLWEKHVVRDSYQNPEFQEDLFRMMIPDHQSWWKEWKASLPHS